MSYVFQSFETATRAKLLRLARNVVKVVLAFSHISLTL